MLAALTIILTCQLAGEVAARALGLALPGPVIGLVMLLAGLSASRKLAAIVRPTAEGLLRNLSLLFVPAGVGVVAHLGTLREAWLAIALALIVSTILSIAVGALVFQGVARALGNRSE